MRDGHHQGSVMSEQGRSVKDLELRFPAEDTDRLWCWCEQIKGSQNEWNEALSAVERPSHGTEPDRFASNQEGERGLTKTGRERSEHVREKDTESYWLDSCAKFKHCSVLYLQVYAASVRGHLGDVHFNTAKGHVNMIWGYWKTLNHVHLALVWTMLT